MGDKIFLIFGYKLTSEGRIGSKVFLLFTLTHAVILVKFIDSFISFHEDGFLEDLFLKPIFFAIKFVKRSTAG